MTIETGKIVENTTVGKNVFRLTIELPDIAANAVPGQFCEIKINDTVYPLLRRPFSVSDVEGSFVSFLIEVKGAGTEMLARKKVGEELNVIGPLGRGFNIEDDFETAVIVAGGIGVAPFPFLLKSLSASVEVFSYVGARTKAQIINSELENISIATDDGSSGFHGNVVELLANNIERFNSSKIKIFGCGPIPMLAALKKFSLQNDINCEVSAESNMACGIGLCQGCAIKSAESEGYLLVCKDGPVFNIKEVDF